MNKADIIDKLSETRGFLTALAYARTEDKTVSEDIDISDYEDEVPGDWRFSTVKVHGGNEGGGEEFWMVFRVVTPDTKVLLRVDGWYASFNGGELDGDIYEVKPVEYVATRYDRV